MLNVGGKSCISINSAGYGLAEIVSVYHSENGTIDLDRSPSAGPFVSVKCRLTREASAVLIPDFAATPNQSVTGFTDALVQLRHRRQQKDFRAVELGALPR
ncbi:hypothetical protein ACGFIW_28225 [Micromonospora sp. NPDC048935]|uniref:hypothetical protein n=1 Tax=Micromonospora sp. NPDC048935 TaxID=3364262 RepID=UPI0037163322